MKKATTLPDELARLLLLETDEDVKTEDDSQSLDYRRDIRSILTALYERAPYIYALFKAAPKTEFRIALTEDFSRGDLPDETYTIPEFCARYADVVSMFFDGQILTTDTPRRFFGSNSFYTTAAHRMSRHIFHMAVTVDDVLTLCRENAHE